MCQNTLCCILVYFSVCHRHSMAFSFEVALFDSDSRTSLAFTLFVSVGCSQQFFF
jgi:hypothetical protein